MKRWMLYLALAGWVSTAAVAEVSLRDRYPGIPDTQAAYVTLGSDAGSSLATLIIEEAGFCDHNAFGIFDLSSGQTRMLELFEGADEPTESVQVNFLDGYAWIDGRKESTITQMSTTFGFYLSSLTNTQGGTFFSDAALNSDGFDHTAILLSPQGGVIVGFENLYSGGDSDYNDLIVRVRGATPIPAPSALILAGLGSLLAVWKKR